MKKIILCVVLLMMSAPAWADVLLSPEEEAVARKQFELKQKKCPKDRPLYLEHKCYSCYESSELVMGPVSKCEEICPNRYSYYNMGSKCGLMTQKQQEQKALEKREKNAYEERMAMCNNKDYPLYHEFTNKAGKKVWKCFACDSKVKLAFKQNRNGYFKAGKCVDVCPNRYLFLSNATGNLECLLREEK